MVNKPVRPPRRRVDGVLLLDKPTGMTSNAALQKVRWLFNAAKAGHTGTLDPMATGLLPICLGEATKFAGELLNADKAYRATLRLGVTTETADAEGRVIETRPVMAGEPELRAILPEFLGQIEQIPPMYSALKRDGKPLYEYARQGIEVERQPRRVTIHRLELVSFSGNEAVIDVDCSKGTYVRTLAADIGERLGCGAHLTALRRTRIGGLCLPRATMLDRMESLSQNELDRLLMPADALLGDLPSAYLDGEQTRRIRHGQRIRWEGTAGQKFRLFTVAGGFLGIGSIGEGSCLSPVRLVQSNDEC